MRAVLLWAVSRAWLIVLAPLLVSCVQDEVTEADEPLVRPIKLLTLSKVSGPQVSRYPGVLQASTFAALSFPVGGLVAEIPVVEGRSVDQGDLVAKLDDRDFRSRLASTESAYRNAEEQYQRAVRLSLEDAISGSVLETRERQRDSAKAQLDVAEKAVEDTIMRAPFSGYVATVDVKASQTVAPGQVIVSMTGSDRKPQVVINLPARVMADWQAVEGAEASVSVDAIPNQSFPAAFESARLVPDQATQTYAIAFSFTGPEEFIVLEGMSATVELTSSGEPASEQKITVPLSAIVSNGDDKYVWVVDDETMVVSKREILTVDGIGETLIVTEGLSGDETIAIAGAAFLGEGVQVRPWDD